MLSSLRLALLACATIVVCASCTRQPFLRPEAVQFRPKATQEVTFEALMRRADALGYSLEGADRMHGVFLVHSRVLGRARQNPRRLENVFVVEVADAEVRVSARGRHVAPDGRMHPRLAEELAAFGDAMEAAASKVRPPIEPPPLPPAYTAQPPSAYEVTPPSLAPPRSYTAPSRALDAP